MVQTPATPPAMAAAPAVTSAVTWHDIWLACDSERFRADVHAHVWRADGKADLAARFTRERAVWEKACNLIALIERHAPLREMVLDCARADKAIADKVAAEQSAPEREA